MDYFIYFVLEGDLEEVIDLIKEGAKVDIDNNYALRKSAKNGNLDMVSLLLDHGADIHAENDYALRISAANGNLDMVTLLLSKGAFIHIDDDYALRHSAANGHLDVVDLLISKGAFVHAENEYALRYSAANGHLDVVKLLVMNDAYTWVRNNEALSLAIYYDHTAIVEYLMEQDCYDIDMIFTNSKGEHFDIVEYSIKHNINCGTILVRYAKIGRLEKVIFLIENSVDIHYRNEYALYWGVDSGNYEIVKTLINYGADINNCAYNLLNISAYNGDYEILTLLVKNGASIYSNNYALRVSVENEFVEIVVFLLSLYNVEELKTAFSNLDFRKSMLRYLSDKDLSPYQNVILAYRELGIDIFDLIENEKIDKKNNIEYHNDAYW